MVVAKENKNESLNEMLSVREAGRDHHWTIFKYEQADVLNDGKVSLKNEVSLGLY